MIIQDYISHTKERGKEGLPPLPLTPEQTAELVTFLKDDKKQDLEYALELLINRVPAGVDQSAYVKAAFLNDVAQKKINNSLISPSKAVELLGTMLGGYNVQALIPLLDSDLAEEASQALSSTILVFDAFHDVVDKHKDGNEYATKLLQ